MYLKNAVKKKNIDLSSIREEGKRQYLLIKDSNTLMYDHTLNRERKHSGHYCLEVFSSEKILKFYIENHFKINGKQRIKMPEKGEYIISKYFERKINCHL